ncbi:neuron navigator 1-like isoform X1 [Megalops cyprinoides]|uniref:neuron navigator 1-like isoform X1 n=1 Tax=Megalops cyprinoides TaxID=118141 RepID=UPI001864A91B|nr:neuron navigator 1-like isoform X1 [Megalops cyprinoides]
MLGASVKGREEDLKTDLAEGAKVYSQAEGKGSGMAAKRGKPGVPQGGTPRGELRVFRAGSSEGRLPVPSNLRKQKSLTNLAVLTDAEKKMQLYQPEWRDDMGKPGTGSLKAGKSKPATGGGAAPLSRNLSKSEHSLFQGKPRPFSPLAAPAALGKQSRIPRGPYAEVKPLSKAPDDGKSDDEILSGKAKAEGKPKQQVGGPGEQGAKGQGADGDKPFLKVDPELVVTVLGDLEQLLFSQMLDPESQRKRTVQNVLDLRQNLEDTMSSLRGSQLSHSCLETSVCYDSDETNARSMSSMSNRSSPLSWRYGQSSPRLQAGDAPSSTGGQGAAQYASHTMPARSSGRLSQVSRVELVESLDTDDTELKSGYLSDSDVLSKSLNEDEDDDLGNGWDESSSISSGLSDGSDNLSSEDFNASSSLNSLPTTPSALRTDAEKRSLAESGLSWYSEDGRPHRKTEGGGYDTGSLKTDSSSKWRKSRPQEGGGDDAAGKAELKKPQSLGQPGTFKKSRNPPVGVTSPITHTSQSLLKVAAQKSDQKPVDKSRVAVKASGLQRSCSDAGRDRGKPPSGLVRPTTGGSFGYKKPPPATGTATVMTAGGATISSGSATVGKTPKSSSIPVKPLSAGGSGGGGVGGGGRKNSLDVSNLEQGFLSPNARSSIQYRSLPRPAKSSAMSLTSRPASRPVSSNIDAALLSLKPAPTPSPALSPTPGSSGRLKEPSSSKANRASVGPVNQTDREKEKAKAKAVASDSEYGPLKPPLTPGEASSKLQGLRQSSGSKYSDLSSPITHRAFGSKSLGRPPSLAHLDKVSSNSLDSCLGLQDLPPKVPPYSKLQDLAGSSATPRLTPSPAPVLHIDSPDCFSGSPLLYPRLAGLHRSMESLPLHLSLPPGPGEREEERGRGTWGAGSRASITLPDSSQRDRNTLPKKGLSRYGQSDEEVKEGKERRHSHTIVSLTESESPPQLPSPTSVSLSSGKAPPTNVVAPTPNGGSAPRIMRSNSIPTHDSAFELYGTSPLGSSLSLADRPKSMIRSGSFREPGDDVHGSVLSLASSASSNYSSAEERMQGEQIRKLRWELETSQEKVANLTSQLSENANLVAAFEQSLALMTSRLQTLSVSAEQKDTELLDLRETIEVLKAKNTEAQVIIQGALNNPDIAPKELRIKRQNSSESIASLNSITSHSSVGSCKDADAKKKKKKSWLRSSFNKAFSIKKGPKSANSYSDIEEIATPDSSAPSSPKLPHEGGENPPSSLRSSTSVASALIFEGNEEPESDEKVVSDLRSELWEKERKLTDIRLEALSSAHQLEQLQEAMNNMQMTVENLKAENDQLKTGAPTPGPPTSSSQPPGLTPSLASSPRLSAAMSLTKSFTLSLSEGKDPDVTPIDSVSLPVRKDDVRLRVVVRLPDQRVFKDEVKQLEFFIGWVWINPRTDWVGLDTAITQDFKDYIAKVDPTSSLGLSTESIYCYHINHIKRVLGGEAPETMPSRCTGKSPCSIAVALKGLREKCVDSLVFETLIPKPMMQHYISLLLKHRRLVLTGPSGTGKTYLTSRLAEYLVERSGREVTPGVAITYNMHRQSCKDLQLYLSNLANQIDRETSTGDIPLVIILDDLSDAAAISELVNGALTCKYHKCPYIIGTTNQPVKMTPNHGLHLSFRMVTFSNNVEPANGFLVRYLHRKLMEAEKEGSTSNEELLRVLDWVPKLWYHLHTFLEKHSTSDFLIGPCFFLSCPVTVEEFRSWFIDLWNHSIIPYLQEGAKDGIKVHGQKAAWEDPVEWVRGTLPWPSAQQDQAKLYHLPPPSMGPGSPGQPSEERPAKETPPSSMESDPLMAMLLKLQEAANYIESPDRETVVDPNLKPTL